MVYNTLEQGDILSAVRVGLAPIAYTDILLRSIWAIDKIRQTPIPLYQECGDPLGSIRLLESVMAERIDTKAFVHQLALRMQVDDNVAAAWLEATVETLYDTFKAGKGVTLTGLGGFYVQPRGKT